MNNKANINEYIKKYLEDNNLILIEHNCIFINYYIYINLNKMFYENIDIKKIYNCQHLFLYGKEYAMIHNEKINIIRNLKLIRMDNSETGRGIEFSWNVNSHRLSQIHSKIFDFFLKTIAPNLTEL